MSRRGFLISLGAGAAAITGYVLGGIPGLSKPKASRPPGQACEAPCLLADVTFGSDNDMLTLSRPGTDSPVCAVNRVGGAVIRRLDGGHKIDDISRILAGEYGLEGGEALEAKVAFFVTQLGMMGFLDRPFYVQIYERATG